MALQNNVLNIPEAIWELFGGGDETQWNEIASWLNAGGYIIDQNQLGRSYPAGALAPSAGLALNVGSGFPRWTFPANVTSSLYLNFGVPGWWNSLRLGYDLVNDGANGNIKFLYTLKGCNAGQAVAAASTFYTASPLEPAPVTGVHSTLLIADPISITHGPFGTLWSLELTRLGGDVSDTAGDIGIEEIVVTLGTA